MTTLPDITVTIPGELRVTVARVLAGQALGSKGLPIDKDFMLAAAMLDPDVTDATQHVDTGQPDRITPDDEMKAAIVQVAEMLIEIARKDGTPHTLRVSNRGPLRSAGAVWGIPVATVAHYHPNDVNVCYRGPDGIARIEHVRLGDVKPPPRLFVIAGNYANAFTKVARYLATRPEIAERDVHYALDGDGSALRGIQFTERDTILHLGPKDPPELTFALAQSPAAPKRVYFS